MYAKALLDSLPIGILPDLMTSLVKTSQKEKLEVLDATDLLERFKLAQPLLQKQIEV